MSGIADEVRSYYAAAFARHGESPRGVDWNGSESQFLRFRQLLKVVENDCGPWSLNDLGCGYGAILEFLADFRECKAYYGYDLVAEMLAQARHRWLDTPFPCEFVEGAKMRPADYTVASGIFNVKGERKEAEWLAYIINTLHEMDAASRKGFACNMLTIYSDPPYMRPHLYYTDPSFIFTYCKKMFSKKVSLIHDYELYEFTVIVSR